MNPRHREGAKDNSLGAAADFVTHVVAPASLLTAILYYFGYVRELALFGYFGVDLGSLQFSTTDYLVRSVGTIFRRSERPWRALHLPCSCTIC